MARYNDSVAPLDADVEVGLLMQLRGMSRQQAIAEMVARREAEAQRSLVEATQMRVKERAADEVARRNPKTPFAPEPTQVPTGKQASQRTGALYQLPGKGNYTDDRAKYDAAVAEMERQGLLPKPWREIEGTPQHEARLWQGAPERIRMGMQARTAVPMDEDAEEDAEEDAAIRRNLSRMRT